MFNQSLHADTLMVIIGPDLDKLPKPILAGLVKEKNETEKEIKLKEQTESHSQQIKLITLLPAFG